MIGGVDLAIDNVYIFNVIHNTIVSVSYIRIFCY